MSLSPVIKNIFTFANILSHAGTEVVSQWDEYSLRNAFNWAKYCVKVEEETRNKSYRQDLDKYVRGLTVFLTPVCLSDLDLNKLKDAHVLLCKRLLQNPDTPLTFVKHISEIVDSRVISEYRCYRQRACYKRNLNKYLAIDVTRDDNSISVSDTAHQVLNTLIDLWHLHADRKQHRFLKFVSRLAYGLLDEDDGMEVLGHVLLASVRKEKNHAAAECVKGRILKALVNPDSLNRAVLGCDTDLLCRLSDRDDIFLQFYLDQLLSWGSAMVPNYSVTSDGNLYSWQYSGAERQTAVYCFQNLLSHLSGLLTYNTRLKSAVEPALLEKRGQSYFSVWKDLLRGVQERSD